MGGASWLAVQAALSGDEASLRRALDQGACLEARDPFGRTAMLAACECGHERCASIVASAGGFDPDCLDLSGRDAVTLAAMAGSSPICQELAASSAVGRLDSNGACALAWACHAGSLECARVLIAAGWSPIPAPGCPDSALSMAARSGTAGLAELLLASGGPGQAAWRDACGKDAAMQAAAAGSEGSLRAIVQACPQCLGWRDFQGLGALACAAWAGSIGCARALIELGAPVGAVDDEGADWLWWAAAAGRREFCQEFAAMRWPWPAGEAGPVHAAESVGHAELAIWLADFDRSRRELAELSELAASAAGSEPRRL